MKAGEFDKKFDAGEDVTGDLDLSWRRYRSSVDKYAAGVITRITQLVRSKPQDEPVSDSRENVPADTA